MRIVGGKWAGRDLASPADRRIRPTAEAVREAWMVLLAAELPEARVLDLFAGTGAMGLEALSRGAARADFVEMLPGSLHALKANLAALPVRERTRLFKRDAVPFVDKLQPDSYDLAFADPPYGSRLAEIIARTWQERRFSRVLAIEHAAEQKLPPGGQRYAHGDTAITVYGELRDPGPWHVQVVRDTTRDPEAAMAAAAGKGGKAGLRKGGARKTAARKPGGKPHAGPGAGEGRVGARKPRARTGGSTRSRRDADYLAERSGWQEVRDDSPRRGPGSRGRDTDAGDERSPRGASGPGGQPRKAGPPKKGGKPADRRPEWAPKPHKPRGRKG